MAFPNHFLTVAFLAISLACTAYAQLSPTFYATSCPNLQSIVRSGMTLAINREARMGASILRLFFHDCFVNGCDASVLLDGGEKNAIPNAGSLRGFEVIDTVKASVEASCNRTVSCADILALAARDSVVLLGGPTWNVPLGRRDARTADVNKANSDLPPPSSNLANLTSLFNTIGNLSARDMTALSGAHTIGQAQCVNFRDHIWNETNIDPAFANSSRNRFNCSVPSPTNDTVLAPLDVRTPNTFNNDYFKNLVARRGLLHSDQELFNGGSQDLLVLTYSLLPSVFARDFAEAMVKMGNISPLTGTNGEIRINCRKPN